MRPDVSAEEVAIVPTPDELPLHELPVEEMTPEVDWRQPVESPVKVMVPVAVRLPPR